MPIVSGYNRVFGTYQSDDGTVYMVGTTGDNAAAGGFSIVLPSAGFPSLPRGYVMRHVYGVASDGSRTKLPIATPATSLWTSGGSFTKYGHTYDSEGKIGEKRTNRGG
jgi:hypothetical protein